MQDNNGGSVGPVGRSFNVYGEYGVSSNSADPVALSFAVPNNGDSFDITASNAAVPSLPYLGGIVGFASTSSNLGPGSFNYIVLGGTAQSMSHLSSGYTSSCAQILVYVCLSSSSYAWCSACGGSELLHGGHRHPSKHPVRYLGLRHHYHERCPALGELGR
jgi:hypothetical protein